MDKHQQDIRILLVEDSADDAELLIFELEQEGFLINWHRVETETQLRTSLQKESWDIVLSDYSMPGFTGLDALYMLRQYDPITPFVLVSGAVGEKVAVELIKEGGQDYVLKDNLVRLPTILSRELADAQIKKQVKKSEDELRESNERLNLIFDSTYNGMKLIQVSTPHRIIESINDSFVGAMKRLGIEKEKEDYIGMLLPYFYGGLLNFSEEEIEKNSQILDKVIGEQKAVHFTETFQFNDKVLHIQSYLTPIVKKGICTHVLQVSQDVTVQTQSLEKLKTAYEEVKELKQKLEEENRMLKEEFLQGPDFEKKLIFQSEMFGRVLNNVQRVAPLDTTVLILGETGTGKELLAQQVHDLSPRQEQAFVKVNCAALPRDLIESELFGHEAGAFTGALKQKIGKFEQAQNGSIFLDEIGELPMDLQPKLLRVIQEGEFERLGGSKTIKLNVRIIAATNRDLKQAIKEGKFREDLYFRLHVFPVEVPPLRERTEDISPLFFFFLKKYAKKFNKKIDFISEHILDSFAEYEWPGNVRELENLVERAMILSKDGYLPISQFIGIPEEKNEKIPKAEAEKLCVVQRRHILKVLDKYRWKINGKEGAAEALGLKPSTLRDRMRKLGIERPQKQP
ncbi:MAG: sigma 54-interacting transcriptional regulator [Bacteroidota bacterium]